jgi:beta-carotene 3-hydroxylase
MLLNIGIVLVTFFAMEGIAWFTHKYIMHGILWFLHRSHHSRHDHALERNDLFFVYYGVVSTVLVIYGSDQLDYRFWMGIGIGLYGLVYFLVHDVFIHRRLRLFGKTHNSYLKALDIAHKVHHKTTGRTGSESFGMLWVNAKFFKLAKTRSQHK